MDVLLINNTLLSELHDKAVTNERLRMNFDLRTTPEDVFQRMLADVKRSGRNLIKVMGKKYCRLEQRVYVR